MNHILKFSELPWNSKHQGAKEKVFSDGFQKLRLVQFDDTFIEEHWCEKAHIAYVTQGEMIIDFDGEEINYIKGDALWILEGEDSKHKVRIGKGKFVELILFEKEI